MNSLTELNNYNNSLSFTYADNRIADVKFNKIQATNQTQIVDEGSEFDSSVGIEITDIADYSVAQPIYTINVSALSGVTVTWDTIPSGCTVTNPSTGVYKISGVNSKAIWDVVKFAKIQLPLGLPNAYFGNWSYTSRIDYIHGTLGELNKSWTTAVTVQDVTLMSNPGPFVYQTNANSTLTTYPQILSFNDVTYPGAIWTITSVPSSTTAIDSFSSTSTGGTFTFNNSTKGFTITGTSSEVNAHLSNLTLDSTTANVDFNLSYLLQNNQDSVTDTKIQVFRNADIKIMNNASSVTIFYNEDAASYDITGAPTVSDLANDGSGTYTLTVTASDSSAIKSMVSTGLGGSTSYNNETKTLTVTGTRTQINSHLTAIEIEIEIDYSKQFTMNYSVVTPLNETATKYQTLICNTNDIEVTNMSLDRNYISNQANLIFETNTPYISDLDTTPSNVYTITLNSADGVWSENGINSYSTYSFSGSRSQVNAKFANLQFYANAGVSSNITFTYTQSKNSVLQTSVIANLLGSAGTYTGARTLTLTETQSWIPSVEDALYGRISKLLLVGGGGGGAAVYYIPENTETNEPPLISYSGGGGGGGGGVYYYDTPMLLTSGQSYQINVGAGGEGGVPGNTSLRAGQNGGTTSAFGLSIAGGGGAPIGGAGGTSGPSIGSSYQDHSGRPGGSASTLNNGLGGKNGGGGGGHLTINPSYSLNGSDSSGGQGGPGFDQPAGANSYIAAGGGGGGFTAVGLAGSSTAGVGAGITSNATSYSAGHANLGGGGGGGFADKYGAKGNDGCVRITLTAK